MALESTTDCKKETENFSQTQVSSKLIAEDHKKSNMTSNTNPTTSLEPNTPRRSSLLKVSQWVKNYDGKVSFFPEDGYMYKGTLICGERFGLGVIFYDYGPIDIAWFLEDEPKGNGVRTNKNGTQFWRLFDGEKYGLVSSNVALKIIQSLVHRENKAAWDRN